jgi:ferredoxin-NADP reductase
LSDLELIVTRAEIIAEDVRQLTLAAPDGARLPSYPPGSHLGIRWRPNRINSYSLTGDGDSPAEYTISVLKVPDSRGGSAWVHVLEAGDTVTAVPPRSGFAPVATARRHLLVAGGIGITPLLSHARWHLKWGNDFGLYYVHKPGRAPHVSETGGMYGSQGGSFGKRNEFWDALGPALARQPLGTMLYVCGPRGLIDAVTGAARALHWPESRVRVEAFGAADEGPREPFRVRCAKSGREIDVTEGETLLEALERAEFPVSSMCRRGVCGECRLPVARGSVDHRDLVLSAAEKAAGKHIMPCVSRAAGDELELRL